MNILVKKTKTICTGTKYWPFANVSTTRILIGKLFPCDPFDFLYQFYTYTYIIKIVRLYLPVIPIPLNNRESLSNRSTDRDHVTFR